MINTVHDWANAVYINKMDENSVSYYMPSLQTDSCNENVKLKSTRIAILSIMSITGTSRSLPGSKKFTLHSDD
jgi:hypothetical protein